MTRMLNNFGTLHYFGDNYSTLRILCNILNNVRTCLELTSNWNLFEELTGV